MATNNEIDGALHDLLKIVLERREGYQKASQYVEDDELSELFETYAKQSEDFALELAPFNEQLESNILGTNSSAKAKKIWLEMKAATTSGDKKVLLDSVISGEEAALDKYSQIIDVKSLPEELYNLVDQQREKISEACESIRMQLNII